MAITPIQGRRGRFEFGAGLRANIQEFSGSIETDRVDVTGFEDQNVITGRTSPRVTDGIDKCVVHCKGYVDATNNNTMPKGMGITKGAVLTNVKLFLNKAVGARCITLAQAVVFKVNYVVTIKDAVKYDVNIESNGDITDPD